MTLTTFFKVYLEGRPFTLPQTRQDESVLEWSSGRELVILLQMGFKLFVELGRSPVHLIWRLNVCAYKTQRHVTKHQDLICCDFVAQAVCNQFDLQ